MAKNKFMAQLLALEGAVTEKVNVFENVLRTVTPSVNSTFGRGWGLPLGYTAVVFGPPKQGKTVFTHLTAGHMQMSDPDAMWVKFDTEYRTEGQLTDDAAAMFGIDLDRTVQYQTNKPKDIFDRIETKVADMCDQGAPIKLVVIDSLYGIQGRRAMDAESVEKQIIGDHAATIQDGLKRILSVQRKYKFAVILVDQVRSEMDPLEQKRGNKFKMRSSFAVQHHAEYFIACERNNNKEGRADIAGNEFVDESSTDMFGKGDKTGAKFKVKMRESSMGPSGRTGEYTLDFKRGVVNIHEEVYKLAKNRGVLHRPNLQMYEFEGQSWRGESAMVQAIANDQQLQQRLIAELMRRDMNHSGADEVSDE